MDNTLLVCLSQQMATYGSIDTIANNLANLSTPGFKRDSTIFEEYVQQTQPTEDEFSPQSVSFVWNRGTARDFSPGRIETTSAPFDFAINGKGYFVVQTANGPAYTRDGHFRLDGQGRIVTEAGDPLQGDGGDVTIAPEDGDIHVARDGTITGQKGQLGKLQLVQFANETRLAKQGSNLFTTSDPTRPATDATIKQGALESSNVEPVVEISHMLDVMRAYQAMAGLTQSHEDQQRQTIDKLAATQS